MKKQPEKEPAKELKKTQKGIDLNNTEAKPRLRIFLERLGLHGKIEKTLDNAPGENAKKIDMADREEEIEQNPTDKIELSFEQIENLLGEELKINKEEILQAALSLPFGS